MSKQLSKLDITGIIDKNTYIGKSNTILGIPDASAEIYESLHPPSQPVTEK